METDMYGYREFPCTCGEDNFVDCEGCLQWRRTVVLERDEC